MNTYLFWVDILTSSNYNYGTVVIVRFLSISNHTYISCILCADKKNVNFNLSYQKIQNKKKLVKKQISKMVFPWAFGCSNLILFKFIQYMQSKPNVFCLLA